MASQSSKHLLELAVPQQNRDQTQTPPSKFDVVKDYKSQGELTLHRLSSPAAFTRGRCKLIATYSKQWDDLRYNGCYSQLLSKA